MISVHVKLFAAVKDIVGTDAVSLTVDDRAQVSAAFEKLAEANPLLKRWKGYVRFAVNRAYVQPDHPLRNGDVVAIIPPVSGG